MLRLAARVMKLAATEFLRRFFLRVLPKGFVRIRHSGFLANRWRSSRLSLCRKLLALPSKAAGRGFRHNHIANLALPPVRIGHGDDTKTQSNRPALAMRVLQQFVHPVHAGQTTYTQYANPDVCRSPGTAFVSIAAPVTIHQLISPEAPTPSSITPLHP